MNARTAEDLTVRFPRLVDESGGFAMIANDQRESLRAILARSREPQEVPDEELRAFKRSVTRMLTPHGSAILLDRPYGITPSLPSDVSSGCGIIVAADVLHQQPGGIVEGSTLDPLVTPDYLRGSGAAAAKLLVIWEDRGAHRREKALIDEFLGLCADAGVASLVEGIVRPTEGAWRSPEHRHDAVEAAAVEICERRPDIYKAEVPGYVGGDIGHVAECSARLTERIATPWVVLSNGVRAEEFPAAVREAVSGGASGFLAGRGIWARAAASNDPETVLASESVERLRELTTIVREGVTP